MGLGPPGHQKAEECVAVGGDQGVVVGPVDLELAVGIFVIGLVRAAAVAAIRQGRTLPVEQKELSLHTCAKVQASVQGSLQLAPQHSPRAVGQGFPIQNKIGGHPAHFWLAG